MAVKTKSLVIRNGRWVSLLLLALTTGIATTVLTNCSSNSSQSSTLTFTTVYNETLSPGCASCHSPGGSAFASGVILDFSTQAQAFATINGMKVRATDASACLGVAYVAPGNATNSYLVAMAIPSYNTANFAGVANCQPYAGHTANLSANEQTDLIGWINAGATNN